MATTSERVPAASGVVWAAGHRAATDLRRAVVYVLVSALSCAGVVTTYALAAKEGSDPPRAPAIAAADTPAVAPLDAGSARNPAPSAAEFAVVLVGTTNQFAAANGDATRIGNADCVEGSVGRYMCSFMSKHPGGARECHIMQARWTPDAASSFTVTLAGRVARCGSLREALLSLR